MKKAYLLSLLFLLSVFTFQSCQDNDDVAAPANLDIQDFIWKGLNQYYLWQADVPNLADDRFNQTELNAFLKGYPNPETLFQSLLYKPSSLFPNPKDAVDRFSWIVDDYLTLEQQLQGTSKNNGVDFELRRKSANSNEIFGYVHYILPKSDAFPKDIKRGDVFYGVNGTQLTVSNYQSLLYGAAESYTLNFANLTYDSNNAPIFTPNGKSLALTKTILDENPIFINKVIINGTHRIGYLMYNGFYSNYDNQLNDAFGFLKSEGVTDLVLDLRYNGGGSVLTSTRLASMITGSLTGQVFAKLKWNEKNSDKNTNYPFPDKIEATPINSLNMTKIYILTSKGTASASELIINGLKPYMPVVQIGDLTYGKNVASITLYDSPSFGTANRNPYHRYAMQPIVANTVNSAGFGDYLGGLEPTFQLIEHVNTYGVLGDQNEPLLNMAISKITGGTARTIKQSQGEDFKYFTDSKSMNGQNQMHIDKLPEGFRNTLK
ncbi:S41 family peptidase [Flavobacterium gawalongense]|uniref:Peptidase S41 n=1 Tax=Flavobacterium gawalongense TaxID=2594432 RepID=A0A553BE26_9FLAO|nr:S41 family peptidase [Flavobacterium gawalongense]TRW98906.1 peptidase S41 [Flavobacterium gawalongense]TRX03509.1 peptidase S41 [Flavobacterium gawalongense]TRX06472.1 peptidase S41 [Flavobacterium gawalongense]TRX07297.1 peptidase S41 [Flavobacterium gawalongense]TRX24999.1 peptidase S41 [Flavobacterium gawalongense]